MVFLYIIILVIITGIVYSLIQGDYKRIHDILVLSFAALTFLMREFIRTVNYGKLRIKLAVKIDEVFVVFAVPGFRILMVV